MAPLGDGMRVMALLRCGVVDWRGRGLRRMRVMALPRERMRVMGLFVEMLDWRGAAGWGGRAPTRVSAAGC